MNNRLTIQDLAGLLAKQTGKEKKSIELFLREFISVITEGVFTDKLVKIKGIGTFKIVLVEKRESVHVNTGERILIPAHYKFSFAPDKELKEEVNRPFSIFETIELNDGVDFTELDHNQEIQSQEENADIAEPDGVQEEQSASELLVPEELTSGKIVEGANVSPEEKEITEEATEFSAKIVLENEKDLVQEEALSENIQELSSVTDESLLIHEGNEKDPEDHAVIKEISTSEKEVVRKTEPEVPVVSPGPDESVVKSDILKENISFQKIDIEDNNKNTKSKASGKILLLSFLLILIMSVGIGYIFNDLIPRKDRISLTNEMTAEVVVPAVSEELVPVTDNYPSEEEQTLPEEPAVQEPVQTTPSVSKQDVIATVKIEAGSRLTLISLEYYGHKIFWVYLYEYNKATIQDPNNIPIGTQIQVPAPELYDINPRSKTSLEKAATLQTAILTGQ